MQTHAPQLAPPPSGTTSIGIYGSAGRMGRAIVDAIEAAGASLAGGVDAGVIAAMKKGTTLNVSVQNQTQREVTFAVPITGFGKAFDGPAIDPKVLEEQQKKLQAEMEKRSEDMRKKLEQQGSAGAAPAPAAPAASAAPK